MRLQASGAALTMKKSFLYLILVSVAVLPARSETPTPADHSSTEIGGAMKSMSKAYKQLRIQVADPSQNTSSLELVAKMKAGAVESRKYEPAEAKSVPEKDRAAFVKAYQEGLDQLIETLGKLEAALKTGKNEDAVILVTALGKERKAGHAKFNPER